LRGRGGIELKRYVSLGSNSSGGRRSDVDSQKKSNNERKQATIRETKELKDELGIQDVLPRPVTPSPKHQAKSTDHREDVSVTPSVDFIDQLRDIERALGMGDDYNPDDASSHLGGLSLNGRDEEKVPDSEDLCFDTTMGGGNDGGVYIEPGSCRHVLAVSSELAIIFEEAPEKRREMEETLERETKEWLSRQKKRTQLQIWANRTALEREKELAMNGQKQSDPTNRTTTTSSSQQQQEGGGGDLETGTLTETTRPGMVAVNEPVVWERPNSRGGGGGGETTTTPAPSEPEPEPEHVVASSFVVNEEEEAAATATTTTVQAVTTPAVTATAETWNELDTEQDSIPILEYKEATMRDLCKKTKVRVFGFLVVVVFATLIAIIVLGFQRRNNNNG